MLNIFLSYVFYINIHFLKIHSFNKITLYKEDIFKLHMASGGQSHGVTMAAV